MFGKLFGRPKDAAPILPAPQPEVELPCFISLEMDVNTGNVSVHAHFPLPKEQQDVRALGTNLGSLVFLLNEGRLLPLLQQGLVKGGLSSGAEDVSQIALNVLNKLMAEKDQQLAQKSQPAIRPTVVFSPHRPGNGVPE